ncbi:MAG: bifunctional riboflavin kinase/FAD synthetase [Gammaproteobacteria bacterium]|nr:bifunctional riboflavin kinase/FAD synthetase [Gammaproteobacteria bacterium]
MELVRGLYNLRGDRHGCVATIGNFDGVHRGHQAVIEQCVEQAAELALPVTLITFEPQPREYFHPQSAPARLTRLREKIRALDEYGVGRMLCLPFNDHLAGLDPETFIREILVDGAGVKHLVVGDDFRFGKDRAGNFSLLQQAGARHGFEVASMHTYCLGEGRVSSTRVRDALLRGDLDAAATLLGRPYAMSGRVAHGDKRGRTIGFPTANVFLHRAASPLAGVFAVQMDGVAAQPVTGVANVGSRPTVDGTSALLEVHLFDFDRDIYGKHVQVSFMKKIRDERRFESFEALREQIQADARQAKDFFRSVPG